MKKFCEKNIFKINCSKVSDVSNLLILCVKILMPAKKLSIREEIMGIFDEFIYKTVKLLITAG